MLLSRNRSRSPRHCFDRADLNMVGDEIDMFQRDLRSSADSHALRDNRYKAATSPGVSVFEPRGAIMEGSMILTGHQLLKLNKSFRKPDVQDTVRSEPSSLGQYLRSTEQIPDLIHISAQILEAIKMRPELYAALSSTIALKILQSYVSGSVGPDAPPSSSVDLDLVDRSLKLIEAVDKELQAEVALSSQLPRASDPGGVGPNVTGCGNVELIVNRPYSGEKDPFAKWSNEEYKLPNVGKIKEGENEGESNDKVKGNTGEQKEPTYGKNHYAFKCALVDLVKELLSPTYNKNLIDKESFKITVKKVVDKVISSAKSIDIPWTPENINNYLLVSRPNISRLVQVCVDPQNFINFHSISIHI